MASAACNLKRYCPEEQLRRFGTRHFARLKACADLHERVAQLAYTFPVLFFALATRYGPQQQRRSVIKLAVEGQPIAALAAALELPLCLRRLSPEACRAPLAYFPWSSDASLRLASHIPTESRYASAWLDCVTFAGGACDEEFAIWLASQKQLRERSNMAARVVLPLALLAWHSKHSDTNHPLHPFTLWEPTLAFPRAVRRAAVWVRYVQLKFDMGEEELSHPWIKRSTFDCFEFHPLLTARDVAIEATEMRNCVDTYGYRLVRGCCRLFSMRKFGQRVATLEVRADFAKHQLLLGQLKGFANAACPLEVWHAAGNWLEFSAHKFAVPTEARNPVNAEERFRGQLQPYLQSRDGLPARWMNGLSLHAMNEQLKSVAELYGC